METVRSLQPITILGRLTSHLADSSITFGSSGHAAVTSQLRILSLTPTTKSFLCFNNLQRRVASLSNSSDSDQSICRSSVNRGIVCAEVLNRTKTAALKDRLEFGSRPASHHEAIVARMFSSVVDQSVRFGQKKLLVLRIEFRHARERQLSAIRVDALLEEGLPLLAVLCCLPLAHIKNQHASSPKSASKRAEDRIAATRIDEVVENTATENRVVSAIRQREQVPDVKRNGMRLTDGLTLGDVDEFWRPIDSFYDVTSATELDRVPSRSAAGVEESCARDDAACNQPGRYGRAFLGDRTVDQQVERPRELTVKRATGSFGHGSHTTVQQRCRADYAAQMSHGSKSSRSCPGEPPSGDPDRTLMTLTRALPLD